MYIINIVIGIFFFLSVKKDIVYRLDIVIYKIKEECFIYI